MAQLLLKTVWRFFKNLKIELLYDLAVSLLNMHPKKAKTLFQRDACILIFMV